MESTSQWSICHQLWLFSLKSKLLWFKGIKDELCWFIPHGKKKIQELIFVYLHCRLKVRAVFVLGCGCTIKRHWANMAGCGRKSWGSQFKTGVIRDTPVQKPPLTPCRHQHSNCSSVVPGLMSTHIWRKTNPQHISYISWVSYTVVYSQLKLLCGFVVQAYGVA